MKTCRKVVKSSFKGPIKCVRDPLTGPEPLLENQWPLLFWSCFHLAGFTYFLSLKPGNTGSHDDTKDQCWLLVVSMMLCQPLSEPEHSGRTQRGQDELLSPHTGRQQADNKVSEEANTTSLLLSVSVYQERVNANNVSYVSTKRESLSLSLSLCGLSMLTC